jgi:hypothetical protein
MKSTIALLASGLLLLASCRKEEKKETVVEETTVSRPAAQAATEKQCYLKVIAKDSIIVEVERTGDSIHGIYHWKPFVKDKKISTYRGTITGNTANVIAESMQEGMKYDEEVVFIMSGKTLEVKYGEMIEENGIWKYKDMNATSEQVLDKVDCKN